MKKETSIWLTSICGRIPGTSCGAIFPITTENHPALPVAVWPEGLQNTQFAASALKTVLSLKRHVLLQQRGEEQDTGEPKVILALPLYLNEKIYGVAVLQITSRAQAKQQEAMHRLEEAAAWFDILISQHQSTSKKQLVIALELLAGCLDNRDFHVAATEAATSLAANLACERVSIGMLRNHALNVVAISHSLDFEQKSGLIRSIQEAMFEAVDQDTIITFPKLKDDLVMVRCHDLLSKEHGAGHLLTIPFTVYGDLAGVVLFERPADLPFDQTSITHSRQLVSMLGPLLEMKKRTEQSLLQTLRTSLSKTLGDIFGPHKLKIKLVAGTALILFIVAATVKMSYRLAVNARLEPMEQRVIVAPQAGFIAKSTFRPGDIVQKDGVLGTLDDKDLLLEQQKWTSQLQQMQKEYRSALAQHERSQVNIIRARLQKAKAQLDLIDAQLARVKLTAPFDGRIVSGDLSQAAGAPVERGQVLFTIAPLTGYRVVLLIDETDIDLIRAGQHGRLLLSGMPKQPQEFTVARITPVSEIKEGCNYFMVEAELTENSDLLRPGMTGVAKIGIDQRRILWILTHELTDRLRLLLWSWQL